MCYCDVWSAYFHLCSLSTYDDRTNNSDFEKESFTIDACSIIRIDWFLAFLYQMESSQYELYSSIKTLHCISIIPLYNIDFTNTSDVENIRKKEQYEHISG